ncbi:MAG: hypothetical protein RSB59_04940 [Clostridia bacterium]
MKAEKFIKEQLWQLLIVVAFVALFAWIFDKPIEAVMFCVAHLVIRAKFDKQYHSGLTSVCLFITLTIAFLGIATCLSLSVSLLSAIPIATFVCWVGYLAQAKTDCYIQLANIKKQNVIAKIDIYTLNDISFYDYCKKCGLSEEDSRIAYFVVIERLKGKEFYQAIGYSEAQSKRKRKYILEKLK